MSYAGDVNSQDAYKTLCDDPVAVMVDVRTQAEWTYVGSPDIQRVLYISWLSYPDCVVNSDFVAQVEASGVNKAHPVYLLCRSGARSAAAATALTAAGYTQAYNIADGFEGDLHTNGQRGHINGWKASRLPWRQS